MPNKLWRLIAASVLVAVACGSGDLVTEPPVDGASTTGSTDSVESSSRSADGSADSTGGVDETTTTTVAEGDTFGWEPTVLGSVAESASMRFAAGPGGWLVSVSEDSFKPPALWFSADGQEWSRVAELPIERVAIGAPLVGVGPTGLVAVKVGDPEAEAFGEPSELAVWLSADGGTWAEADPAGFEGAGYLYDLRSTEFGWLVAGEYVVDPHTVVPAIYWSADGASWRRVARGSGWGAARSVIAGDGDLLVVGSEGGFPMVWHSKDGTNWSGFRLSAATHGGEATAGAWLDGGWLVVGTGSETEPMTRWKSTDGARWEKVGQFIETSDATSIWQNSFGSGVRLGDELAVGATMVRYAHENFCYETERCFVTTQSVLFTSEGSDWWEIPAPPSDSRLFSDTPWLAVTSVGDLLAASIFEGTLTVWTRSGSEGATAFRQDPPVPELTMERAKWGQHLQPDTAYAWTLGTHCGIGQLGEFNGQIWQLEDLNQPPADGAGGYGFIYGVIVLSESENGPTITYTAGDQVIGRYSPQPLGHMRMCG